MSEVDHILNELKLLGVEDTKRISQAATEHLEELDEIAAYDAAKDKIEEVESLDAVLARHSKSKGT